MMPQSFSGQDMTQTPQTPQVSVSSFVHQDMNLWQSNQSNPIWSNLQALSGHVQPPIEAGMFANHYQNREPDLDMPLAHPDTMDLWQGFPSDGWSGANSQEESDHL